MKASECAHVRGPPLAVAAAKDDLVLALEPAPFATELTAKVATAPGQVALPGQPADFDLRQHVVEVSEGGDGLTFARQGPDPRRVRLDVVEDQRPAFATIADRAQRGDRELRLRVTVEGEEEVAERGPGEADGAQPAAPTGDQRHHPGEPPGAVAPHGDERQRALPVDREPGEEPLRGQEGVPP